MNTINGQKWMDYYTNYQYRIEIEIHMAENISTDFILKSMI